jgi:hypothetical protein
MRSGRSRQAERITLDKENFIQVRIARNANVLPRLRRIPATHFLIGLDLRNTFVARQLKHAFLIDYAHYRPPQLIAL